MKKLKILLMLLALGSLTACASQKTVPIENQQEIAISDSKNNDSQFLKLDSEVNIFYFAYGSNMSTSRMLQRCGEDNFLDLGQAKLADYDFYFYGRGYANIKEKASQEVEGVLFRISDTCLRALDQVEGYPNVYQRRIVKVNFDQKNILAQVYLVENDQTFAQPSEEYYQVVLSGAEEHGLSAAYLAKIKALFN